VYSELRDNPKMVSPDVSRNPDALVDAIPYDENFLPSSGAFFELACAYMHTSNGCGKEDVTTVDCTLPAEDQHISNSSKFHDAQDAE